MSYTKRWGIYRPLDTPSVCTTIDLRIANLLNVLQSLLLVSLFLTIVSALRGRLILTLTRRSNYSGLRGTPSRTNIRHVSNHLTMGQGGPYMGTELSTRPRFTLCLISSPEKTMVVWENYVYPCTQMLSKFSTS